MSRAAVIKCSAVSDGEGVHLSQVKFRVHGTVLFDALYNVANEEQNTTSKIVPDINIDRITLKLTALYCTNCTSTVQVLYKFVLVL